LSDQKTQLGVFGGKLIKAFHNIINTVRIHQDNNRLIKECVAQFNNALTALPDQENISIEIWRGRFHLQGEKLLYQRETVSLINEMLEYFFQRNLGGLQFFANFREAMHENIVAFIRLLNESVTHEDPSSWLDQKLEEHGFLWVEVFRKQDETLLDVDIRRKEKARQTYIHALDTVKEVAEKASTGVAGVRKARRLAQTMVDLIQDDNSLMMGLTTIRDYDDYTYTHSVNVALLATFLGRYIGLSRVALEHLTICGLFHDLGKVGVSKDILLKQGELDTQEWIQMRRHPLIGVRKILKLQAPRSLKAKIILGPFEHHLNPDLSGYPKTHLKKDLSLFGKILRIVDVYDALTSEREYRPRAFSPDEALRRMWSEKGKSFDPLLLKSFINMIGVYPIGTILDLETGETGLVMDYPDESDKTLPLIMLLVDDGQGGLTCGELVNLATQDLNNGKPQRNIVRGVPFSRFGIQPSQFFLQESM
jgi:HD-GYP domain-containing protein (c-di-GMP phosphodiesterase class II)